MHRSNATGLVDRLERRGLAQRHPHPTDRRAHRIVLTGPGRELVERIHPHYFAAADRVWATQNADQVDALLSQLRELAFQAAAVAGTEEAIVAATGDESAAALPSLSVGPLAGASPRQRPRPRTGVRPEPEPAELRTSDL